MSKTIEEKRRIALEVIELMADEGTCNEDALEITINLIAVLIADMSAGGCDKRELLELVNRELKDHGSTAVDVRAMLS